MEEDKGRGIFKMTGKERVLNAVNHIKSDRVPMDIWAEPEVWDMLKIHFNVLTYDDVRDKLSVDIHYIQPPSLTDKEQPNEEGIWYNEWGVGYKRVKHATGYYDDVVYHPLANFKTVKEGI